MPDVHVVFGAGPVGLALVDELVAQAIRVRVVSRSGRAQVPAGVEVMAGDVSNPEFATRAAVGAAAVYQCMSPPYHRWAELFPALQDSVVQAARRSGARYVSFENTYMYGDTGGAPMTELTPLGASTRKGKVRLAMARRLKELNDAGELAVATARAADYFGPRGTDQSPLGDLVTGAAIARKPARVLGDPDQLHSYTYLPDAGRTLLALGTRDDVVGEVFHIPNAPAETTRQIIHMISLALGLPIKVSLTPRLLVRLMGLFKPTIAEVDEMLYEFNQSFVVESAKAQARLGINPTPLTDAIATTVAWFREQAQARRSEGRASTSSPGKA